MRKHSVTLAIPVLLILGCALFSAMARAQDALGSLSDSLSEQSDTAGLDTSYAGGAGALGVTSQVDVTDATHSDVLTTSMSPLVDGTFTSNNVNADSNSHAPLEDALQLSASNGDVSRTPRDISFTNPSFSTSSSAVSFSGSDGFGKGAGDDAFRTTLANGISNNGAARTMGADSSAMDADSSRVEKTEGSSAGALNADVDPVLLPIGTDAAMNSPETSTTAADNPASEAASFFMMGDTEPVAHQFDDGVTPLSTVRLEPGGQLLPVTAEYSDPPNGFPDSTLGLAGSPLDTSEIHAPGGLKTTSGYGLAAGGDGPSFDMKTALVPNLYAVPPALPMAHLRAQQDRIFEQNILNGMNVTEAEIERRKALQAYRQRSRGGSKARHDLLNQQEQGNTRSLLPDTPAAATIR